MNGKSHFFLLLALFLGGCDFTSLNPKKGDVAKVEPGWTVTKVVKTIGDPEYVISGKGVKTGSEELVYPTGSVFLYRLKVVDVIKRGADDPRPEPPKDGWGYKIDGLVE